MTLQLPPSLNVAFHQYGDTSQFQTDLDQLHAIEREYALLFRNAERQRACAAARVACQRALERSRCSDIAVIPDDHGTPTAVNAKTGALMPNISVSLAHRDGVAGALVCTDETGPALGLDLERPRAAILKTMDDFFVASEREKILKLNENEAIRMATYVWAAREATLKAACVGFAVAPGSVEILHVGHDGGRALLSGIESKDSQLEVGLRFGEVEDMITCVAWIPGRTAREMRALRGQPRRSFVWTGIQDKFQRELAQRRSS